MTPFDGFLSGTRGALLMRNLVLRALSRPRLKVEAHVAQLWLGDGTGETPLSLFTSVANPSPHPLVLSHIGVTIGKGNVAFPDGLKTILGPLAQFDSRHASITIEALEGFIRQYGGPVPLPDMRIVVTDGLGKDWYSQTVKARQPAKPRDATSDD